MHEIANPSLAALLQVILIDIVLAGDNAVVIGMAAANVPKPDRAKVVFWGLTAAVVLRVILATMTASILEVIGLMFAGGILLLWVCWRLWRDIKETRQAKTCATGFTLPAHISIRRAIVQIVLADLSMSLDNVLAVAGAQWPARPGRYPPGPDTRLTLPGLVGFRHTPKPAAPATLPRPRPPGHRPAGHTLHPPPAPRPCPVAHTSGSSPTGIHRGGRATGCG